LPDCDDKRRRAGSGSRNGSSSSSDVEPDSTGTGSSPTTQVFEIHTDRERVCFTSVIMPGALREFNASF